MNERWGPKQLQNLIESSQVLGVGTQRCELPERFRAMKIFVVRSFVVRSALIPWFLGSLLLGVARAGDGDIDYNRDIRPLLSDRCFACHGPDEHKRESELRLDAPEGEQGPFHPRGDHTILIPGDPDGSELWKRLTTDDPALQMPPPESGKRPLTPEQSTLFRKWIEQGAKYGKFWSFEPPRSHQTPAVEGLRGCANRIDPFVLAAFESKGWMPQPTADPRTLIRRVTLDLTGLPPSLQEIQAFESDTAPDAYERLVDRLLASPQYGEHMARYWLDLVRFADTNGMHHDHYRELSTYRDWVIRAFNANMPFDQFVTEQLAGDLLENATIDQQIASGYNRLHMVMDKGTNPPQESYTRNVVDQVVAFGTVFMGMTLECSVCHDHKYDPVQQKDFYQLFAFFNNIDGDPETPGRDQQPPYLKLPTSEQSIRLMEFDEQIASLKQRIGSLKQELTQLPEPEAANSERKPSDSSAGEDDPSNEENEANAVKDRARRELTEAIAKTEAELRECESARNELDRAIPIALIMKERTDIRPAYILRRGAYDQPADEVFRNTPAFLPPIQPSGSIQSRLDLAKWVTDRRNPLTARVTVNRYWQQFFGVGIVRTSEDFGAQGEYPSHPELLDDLATEFMDSDWNVKELVRSIVMSNTYRQSSRVPPSEYRADPENRLLARGSRIRLDSEVIRDEILAISGLLHGAMYGKSVKPPQPTDLWRTVSMVSSSTYSFQEDSGDKIYRRSFYTFWKRAMPPPQMTIFDAPTRESCTSRRERTNTPVQALLLMNETQYFEAAQMFAKQLLSHTELNNRQRLQRAFESVTAQLPTGEELDALQRGFEGFVTLYREDVDAARAATSRFQSMEDAQRIPLAAMTMVVHSLFNLDAAKTRE